MSIQSIAKAFGEPLRVQVGFDGVWETALHLPIGVPLRADDREAIHTYQGKDVAFEVFFGHPYGEAFVGVRPQISSYQPLPVEELIRSLIQHPQLSLSIAASLFQEHLNLPQSLFTGSPAHIEMGLVNQWNSFGQIILWHGKSNAYAIDHLANNDAKRYLQPQEKPIGVEFAFANPHHWLAVPVSSRVENGLNQLDLQQLSQTLIALSEPS